MLQKLSVCLLLAGAALPAAQNSLLAVNYSELIPTGSATSVYSVATATDSQGAIYILVSGPPTYYLVKLLAVGNQVVYQTALNFAPSAMAVDAAGYVYLAGAAVCSPPCAATTVEKLGTDGKTVVYATAVAQDATLAGIAVDNAGRAYVTGWVASGDLATTPGALETTPPSQSSGTPGFVVRLKASGAVDYATYIGGTSGTRPAGIAVDSEGSAFVTGSAYTADFPTTPRAFVTAADIASFSFEPFLIRLSADGSSLMYSTFIEAGLPVAVAVDGADNALVALASGTFQRINAQGTAALFTKVLPASYPLSLAVDAAGNSYAALSASPNFAAWNSVAPCAVDGSAALAVLDPEGNLLQGTYVPGSHISPMAVGLGAGGAVYVIGSPDATYVGTTHLSGVSGGLLFLTGLAPSATAAVLKLACMANAASYDSAAISGGEIVSLFGQGLGPSQGVQAAVTAGAGFPNVLAEVQVTFNGVAGPLLYAQDAQINAIAPWVLTAGDNVEICASYKGTVTNCITRPVWNQHPGVFTVDGVYAAAFNQDGTLNTASNPAAVGSTVSIFATGLGPISPAQPDGAIIGFPLPVNVLADYVYWVENTFIGQFAINTVVSYGGPAPYEVAGVSQVNFVVVNTTIPPYQGGQAPFVLQAGQPPGQGRLAAPESNSFLVHVGGE